MKSTLEQQRFTVWQTHGCQFGKCSSCERNCQIQQYRANLANLKVSFCPGRDHCKRPQLCSECRSTNLDLNVSSETVRHRRIKKPSGLLCMLSKLGRIKKLPTSLSSFLFAGLIIGLLILWFLSPLKPHVEIIKHVAYP
jgi:hypothetical protein